MNTHVSRVVFATAQNRSVADRWFYVAVTILVMLVNVVGFSPSLVNTSTRTVPLPLTAIDLAHALVSVAWLLVFLVQVTLVASGRLKVHRQLGVFGVLLSAAFIVVTWFMLVEGARRGFDLSGDLVPGGTPVEPGMFLAPAGTLIPLGAFVGAAVWYRRRSAVHKRLMMLALLSSTGAPIAHVVGHWPAFGPYVLTGGTAILFLPAIRDWVWQRRIHPVSVWGGIFVTVWVPVCIGALPQTAVWRNFAAWVVQ
jgi:hypothetical protein